jgi:hypothetical protein
MMDTSETYIKMCEKATEIQTIWEVQGGDWYVDLITFVGERFVEIIGGHSPKWEYDEEEYNYLSKKTRSFWLPRQDQLQEMFIQHWYKEEMEKFHAICFIQMMKEWIINYASRGHPTKFPTLEQFYLVLCMDTICNKTWNGEDWV